MRGPTKIRTSSFLVMALAFTSWVALGSGPARSSCAGPVLFVEGYDDEPGGVPVPAGSSVTVVGGGFAEGCNDTPGPCTGGGGSDPMEGIEVQLVPATWEGRDWWETWRPDGPAVTLGTVDAGGDHGFRIEDVVLPSAPGRYMLVARVEGRRDAFALQALVLE